MLQDKKWLLLNKYNSQECEVRMIVICFLFFPHSLPSLETQLSLCCEPKDHSLLIITINWLLLTQFKKSITKKDEFSRIPKLNFHCINIILAPPGYLTIDTDLQGTFKGKSQGFLFIFYEREKSIFWNIYANLYGHSAYMNLKKIFRLR